MGRGKAHVRGRVGTWEIRDLGFKGEMHSLERHIDDG